MTESGRETVELKFRLHSLRLYRGGRGRQVKVEREKARPEHTTTHGFLQFAKASTAAGQHLQLGYEHGRPVFLYSNPTWSQPAGGCVDLHKA